jgi:hypothetical protein
MGPLAGHMGEPSPPPGPYPHALAAGGAAKREPDSFHHVPPPAKRPAPGAR